MSTYIPRIGLEIHAELKTKTKMFCNSPNDSREMHPNVNICPVCMGHPGSLPVVNKKAVRSVLRTGIAIDGELANYSRFDRKNYFYPDLPKGYQISQHKYPLVVGGELNRVKITRIHLEEDTAGLKHTKDGSAIDFNRAGRPLMELVTEPVITSSKEAKIFAEELRLILRYLDVSDADMEKGQMRVEANISLGDSVSKLGVKVEVKNLNSLKAVEQSIEHEIDRQTKVLKKGDKVIQETRGWDEVKQKTFSQRLKEEAHDYRYFPEPDLLPLKINEIEDFKNLDQTIPELPSQKRKRLKEEYDIKESAVAMLINDMMLADFFEKSVSEIKVDLEEAVKEDAIKITVNYITTDLIRLVKEKYLTFNDLLITPENFADLMVMVCKGQVSSRVAKDVLRTMIETGGEPHVIVQEKGLEQISDEVSIEEIVKKIIETNPKAVSDYKNGKQTAIQFLVGMVMKETKGKTNPEIVRDILAKAL